MTVSPRLVVFAVLSLALGAILMALWQPGLGPASTHAAPAPAQPQAILPNDLPDDLFFYTGNFNPVSATGVVAFSSGDGSVVYGPSNASFENDWQVFPGYFDAGPYEDLLLYNGSAGVILLANGDGTWLNTPDTYGLPSDAQISVTDLNGDGLDDVLVDDLATPSLQVLFGNIDGTLTPGPVDYSLDHGANWLAYPGIYASSTFKQVFLYGTAGTDAGTGVILYVNANGTFTQGPRADMDNGDSAVYPGSYAGGKNQLFLYNPSSSGPYAHTGKIWYVDGNKLVSGPANSSFDPGWQVYPGYFDGNTCEDILLYHVDTGISVTLSSNCDETWGDSFTTQLPVLALLTIADFNGGGATDVFVYTNHSNQQPAQGRIYLNVGGSLHWAIGPELDFGNQSWRSIVAGKFGAPPPATPTPTPSPTPTVAATPTPVRTSAPPILKGDVDCDGLINDLDVDTLFGGLAGIPRVLPLDCHGPTDLNCDSHTSVDDVLALLFYLAHVPSPSSTGCPAVGSLVS